MMVWKLLPMMLLTRLKQFESGLCKCRRNTNDLRRTMLLGYEAYVNGESEEFA